MARRKNSDNSPAIGETIYMLAETDALPFVSLGSAHAEDADPCKVLAKTVRSRVVEAPTPTRVWCIPPVRGKR